MSAPSAPFREDRPLDRTGDDLLGFDPIAEGLAAQVSATAASGLVAGITARFEGCGRTSFLNLLHASLVERGVAVLRLCGEDELAPLLRRARAPAGLPPPVALIDDAEPEIVAALDFPEGAPAVVAAWSPASRAPSAGPARELSPLLIDLPHWNARAAAALGRALVPGAEPDELRTWTALLGPAGSPRRAVRLANAALAAAAATTRSRTEVLAALAVVLGLDGLPGLEVEPGLVGGDAAALVEHVTLFCGAVELPSAAAPLASGPPVRPERAEPGSPFGSPAAVPPDLQPESPELEESEAREGTDATVTRRRRCVELAGRGGAESTEELLRLLADDHPSVRLSASHALAALADPAAAPVLRRLLRSPDPSLRRTAAFVLGRLGDEGSREELVRLLIDVNAGVRRAAAAALGKLGGPAVVRPLLLALDDDHAAVRMATETALSRTLAALPEERMDDFLRSGDERLRRAAARAAGRLGLGARETLEELLSEPGGLALEGAEALGRRRESASVPALARAAGGDRGDLRTAALAAIGRIAGGSAAAGLARLLAHDEAAARDAAARALARCPGAFEAVLPYLVGDGDEDLRRSAADALGRCGDRRAIGPLLEAHDRGDSELRRAAAASLVRLGFEP